MPRGLRVTRLLGRGGQGSVYEAVRDQPRQLVAVKVPRQGRDAAAMSEAVEKEAELLANLNHPNVVKVLEVVEAQVGERTVRAVVMELVEEAQSITDFAEKNTLNQLDRVKLVVKVCRAVQHMHERIHAYHRDLKPNNVLVGRDGEPKLIDVGLASSGDPDQRLRQRGFIVGTAHYMAPEQFDRDGAFLTQRTDVYALGVLLFELLTGELPYNLNGLVGDRLEKAITNTPARRLDEACKLQFPALANVVAVALRKERSGSADDRRWSTPGVLADEIERAIHPNASTPNMRRWVAAAIVVLLASIAGISWGEPLAELLTLNGRFESSVFRSVPPPVRDRPLERIAVIGFQTTDEVAEVTQLLRDQGVDLPPINPQAPRTWRPIYAELIRRIANSQANVMAFDIVFNVPTDVDQAFHASAANAKNLPVVVALDSGLLDTLGDRPINTALIRPPVLWGSVSMFGGPDAAWRSEVLLVRGTRHARPSLALRAIAAAHAHADQHRFSLDPTNRRIWIDADIATPDSPSIVRPAASTWSVPTTCEMTCGEVDAQEQADFGVRKGDRIAQVMLAMPQEEQIQAVTRSLADVFRAEPIQLERWFKGRGVFVANMTPLAEDIFGYPDGRMIWGVYSHAIAFEALSTGQGILGPPPWVTPAVSILAAAIVALTLPACCRRWRRGTFSTFAVGLSLTAAIFGACWWLLRFGLVFQPPYAPALAAMLTAFAIPLLATMPFIAPRPRVLSSSLDSTHSVTGRNGR